MSASSFPKPFNSKKILLAISGGIASYKACELCSLLKKAGYQVQVLLSKHACEFVSALTFKTLTDREVYTDQFDYDLCAPLHIELVREADLLLLLPATANLIGKLASGIADDLITTVACAFPGKKVLAPAMNTAMWENPLVQANLRKLEKELDVTVIPPIYGELACKTEGLGKLAELETVLNTIEEIFAEPFLAPIDSPLAGLTVLVTAGGTREEIDPVRYISNRSSGKMGIALADEAHARGAEVTLITTTGAHRPYPTVQVESALEMMKEVERHFDHNRILIMAAAVSDYRPTSVSPRKIKKSKGDQDLVLHLTKSPDILSTLGRIKKEGQILIGFAAESENIIQNASQKMLDKKLDVIVANEITNPGFGLGSDFNEVYLISPEQPEPVLVSKAPKREIAAKILDYTQEKYLGSKQGISSSELISSI